jgi:3-oxoacyl-[acyl-carrier-protein] synthase I
MSSRPLDVNSADKVVITGVGLVTPVGHDSMMAPAAVRAGISRFAEVKGFMTVKGAKAVGSIVSGVTDDRSGNDRLLALAIPALQEALFGAEEYCDELETSQGGVILSLGAAEKPAYEPFGTGGVEQLLDAGQLDRPKVIEIVREGNSGGVVAFSRAIAALREGKVRFCVVGGVDCLVELPSLLWLEDARRLKTDDRPQGFIPGEAAAFVVLELESAAKRRGAPGLACVLGAAYSSEEATFSSEKPLFGKGLADCIHSAISGQNVQFGSLSGIICDLNGEYYRMKEWSLALTRLLDGNSSVPEYWHPAKNFGDIGGASAVVYCVIATAALRHDYFGGDNVLVWTSSDSGGRGSLLISSLPGRKR